MHNHRQYANNRHITILKGKIKMNFADSQTRINLMRAFAGESMARNRYTFAAALCEDAGYHVIAQTFRFTAHQEKEHAEVFYGFLKSQSEKNVDIAGGYPVDSNTDTVGILKTAWANEYEEYETIYPHFGQIAADEGFADVAAAFKMIAEIEKTHGDRFAKFAQLIETDRLFKSDDEEIWICLNCGKIHKGKAAPQICPVCKANIGFAVRANTVIGA